MENLHVESSFEKEKNSDEDSQENLEVPLGSRNSKRHGSSYNRDNIQSSKKKNRYKKRVRTSSFEVDKRDHLTEDEDDHVSNDNKKPQNLVQSRNRKNEKALERDKTDEAPEITHKKLEDAEYKDLGQRYKPDEADSDYVLNDEDEIQKEAKKAEETNIELNESIEKIEEEQDLVFKNKVSKITEDLIEKFKQIDIASDKQEIERLKAEMIAHVFESFLENKQELLK